MSSGWLTLTIVVAVVVVAFGVQVAARQLQRFPVDTRFPGALVDISRKTSWVVRPVELEHLNSIVTESLSSEAVARSKLQPLLDELGEAAPRRLSKSRAAEARRLAGRRARSRRLEERLDELEHAWGLTDSSE